MTGWNQVTFPLLGRDVEGITEIEYDDNVSKEAAYGAGGFPIGTKRMNYEAKAAVTLHFEEVVALQKSLGAGGRLQDIPPFDIPVTYDLEGDIYTDVIRNCEFTNRGVAVKQGDGDMPMKYTLHCSHIDWNV